MDSAEYTAPSDVFSDGVLAAGEQESFSHSLMSPATDGDWDIAFNVEEFMPFVNMQGPETDPSYGYMFNISNDTGVNITYMTVMHGETKTINFVHYLNSHYDQENAPVGGIPYKLDLHVYPYVAPPTAVDDTFIVTYHEDTIIYPLLNDVGGLTIKSVDGVPSGSTAVISSDKTYITYYQGSENPETFSYIVSGSEPLFKEDTGGITTDIINQAPLCTEDAIQVVHDQAFNVNLTGNDFDFETDHLTVLSVTGPNDIHFTVTLQNNMAHIGVGSNIYTGTYYGSYTVSDNHGNTATGSIRIYF